VWKIGQPISAVPDHHGGAVDGRFQQVPKGCRRFLRSDQGGLQSAEVAGDELVAGGQVGSLDDRLDLLQRHVKRPEPADDLSRRDLLSGVAAVTGAPIHIGRLQ
jgi:hypothetical protein